MIVGGNVDGKLSGKKMEEDDNLRKVECLRGRLVAERAASRVAKEDAEQMGNKVTELENKMRVEIKSRNRAEKRLKLLMRKLESLNLSYNVSETSSCTSTLEKSDMSSVSSSSSTNCTNCEIQQSKTKSQQISQDLDDNASQTTTPNLSHCSSIEESLISEEKPNFEEPSEVNSSQDYQNPQQDDLSSSSTSNQAQDDYHVDNSLALVPVDLPKESRPLSDPLIVNASVRDVLDALRHAREKLQLSMERRHMIQVGFK